MRSQSRGQTQIRRVQNVNDSSSRLRLTHRSLLFPSRRWVQRTPGIVSYFESILPFVGMKKDKDRKHLSQKGSLPIAKFVFILCSLRGAHLTVRTRSSNRLPVSSALPVSYRRVIRFLMPLRAHALVRRFSLGVQRPLRAYSLW